MEPTLYKHFKTSRGLQYRYWRVLPASDSHPTLLLLHGFPSAAQDWSKIIAGLRPQGYGLLVPDMLGFAGTDKPLEVASYDYHAIVHDLRDLLDVESVQKAVIVGYDWGAIVASRFYNYASERIAAVAFLAMSYTEPTHEFSVEAFNAHTKNTLGYDVYGYWHFFARDDSHEIIADHLDSFLSVVFPADPETWKTVVSAGKLEEWLLADRITQRPSYLSEEDYNTIRDTIAKHGVQAAMNWYRTWLSGENTHNAKPVHEDYHDVAVPAFFGAATRDFICRADLGKEATAKRCKHPDTVVREYDGDHWIVYSHAQEIARDLVEWIEGLRAKAIL